MPKILRRPLLLTPDAFPEDWHPMVRQLYAARMQHVEEADKSAKKLLPPNGLIDSTVAAQRLFEAIKAQEAILVYGDYDVDGASSTALMVRVLRKLGANVTYFIPNRWAHGYGLSVAGLETLQALPKLVITVDNGTSSFAAAEWLKARDIELIVTDHHEPAATLPAALAVVNPKRKESPFASPNLAGVGVAFYLLLQLKAYWAEATGEAFPVNLWHYLDLVALGTVADIVPLDQNNRILVTHGLRLMRSGKGNLGIRALCEVANVPIGQIASENISFALAPRINAVGRLEDMSDGVAMLLSDDWQTVVDYAQLLEQLNRDRRALESEMTAEALAVVNRELPVACVYEPGWHEGVIGLVAARLKSKLARPALVATDSQTPDKIKASLRSVAGVNIHALLQRSAEKLPAGVMQFGGHAMAAGLSITKAEYPALVKALNESFTELVGEMPQAPIYCDGELPSELLDVAWAKYLEHLEPWGSHLPAPTFANRFYVQECRHLGAQHTRLVLRHPLTGKHYQAAWFFHHADFHYGDAIEVVYRVQVNRFYGDERLDLLVDFATKDD